MELIEPTLIANGPLFLLTDILVALDAGAPRYCVNVIRATKFLLTGPQITSKERAAEKLSERDPFSVL